MQESHIIASNTSQKMAARLRCGQYYFMKTNNVLIRRSFQRLLEIRGTDPNDRTIENYHIVIELLLFQRAVRWNYQFHFRCLSQDVLRAADRASGIECVAFYNLNMVVRMVRDIPFDVSRHVENV